MAQMSNRWMFFYRANHPSSVGRRPARRNDVHHKLCLRYDNHVCEIVRSSGEQTLVRFEDGTELSTYSGELAHT